MALKALSLCYEIERVLGMSDLELGIRAVLPDRSSGRR
jgi:hypothetical protein